MQVVSKHTLFQCHGWLCTCECNLVCLCMLLYSHACAEASGTGKWLRKC